MLRLIERDDRSILGHAGRPLKTHREHITLAALLFAALTITTTKYKPTRYPQMG